MASKIKYIIVHHTSGSDANPLQDSSNYTFWQCDADHKKRFNMKSSLGYYVGYTYYIDKKGTIYQARKEGEEGAHTVGHNSDSIGICLAGNFDATMPTEAQILALKGLMEAKMAQYSIAPENIVPHRKFASKTCYGKKLSDDWARNLVKPKAILITPIAIGSQAPAVVEIQRLLTKAGYAPKPFTSGLYDENMASAILLFQLEKKVADNRELATLRGETVGPKTLTALKLLQ